VLGAFAIGCAYRRLGLEHYLANLSGASQVDCGRFRFELAQQQELSAEQSAKVLSCMVDARRQGKGYRYLLEGPGIDSYIAHGVVAKAGEPPMTFRYDRAPCGRPGCDERFTVMRCVDSPRAMDPGCK